MGLNRAIMHKLFYFIVIANFRCDLPMRLAKAVAELEAQGSEHDHLHFHLHFHFHLSIHLP